MTIASKTRAAWLAALTSAALAVGTGPALGSEARTIPYYHQQLNNDCEAAALRMVLAARGVKVDDQAVLDRIGVDRVHYQFGHSGSLSGDPYAAFVGDPDGSEVDGTGFGVYYPPVAKAARDFGLTVVRSGSGISTQNLKDHLAAGHPAIVWVDYLWRHLASTTYTAYDGKRVLYAGPAEHAVVVTGFGDGTVSVNDPARGRTTVSAKDFDNGYATYGRMAVVIS
ncbi:C39 family peptidase [Kitasatospora aureofaciens]|uniref:C39 family peptidase n=1 Tax=Kitasatospora aureofaciens TaxID=1894 RepID=UPI001C49603D|nr:C39 family peptidase [Kitasatospora aureofaciens]MBV6697741.1 C39 family peptidase [Kitasatospora aureofaciens]